VDGIGNLYVAESSGNVDIYDTTQMAMGVIGAIPPLYGERIAAVGVTGSIAYTAAEIPLGDNFYSPSLRVMALKIPQILENIGAGYTYDVHVYNKWLSLSDYSGYPVGVTGDQAGNSWTADVTNNQIWTTLIPARPKVLINLAYRPGGIALDSLRKRLFVSDPDHNSIHVYNPMTGKERRLIV
jgi:DNA-binding beta-propeller fold protein YncE